MASYNSASLFMPDEGVLKTQYGTGLDTASTPVNLDAASEAPAYGKGQYSDLAKGGTSAMNAGGSAGSALTSAGIYGLMSDSPAASAAGPYALAGGLALSAYEGDQKAKQQEEEARIKEAEQRKAATQNAINQMIGVTHGLGV